MGNFLSRQNAAVEEADPSASHAYKYPPRIGNFFGSHFIMGGERFDTPQPESYLFGENADLNFLGNRPTAFPYPPPQANEPTKTLKSLVNIRKESVRFVRIPNDKKSSSSSSNVDIVTAGDSVTIEEVDGNVLCSMGGGGGGGGDAADVLNSHCSYNIEFTFDSDAKCAITVYYFCTEDVSPSGITLVPRDGLISETYHYDKGINQYFSQPGHVFNPQLIPEDDLIYSPCKEQYPVAIHCVIEEGNEECRQSHTTICVIDHHPETNSYVLRALKQKIFVDGLCYLLQEIYGIENKAVNKSSIDEEIDDHGSECVICMSETRDTLILPCRHLCLCNSCADSLRYQANNCPICRAPFRALLQIRAVQKGISTHVLHQNTPTSGEPTPVDVPPGYIPVSLIEALNGPPQYVGRARNSDHDITDAAAATVAASTMTTGPGPGPDIKATSPIKSGSQRRPKIKKNASTCTTTEMAMLSSSANSNAISSVVEIESDPKKSTDSSTSPIPGSSPVKDKLQIVNERLNKYQKRSSGGNNDDNDDDDDTMQSQPANISNSISISNDNDMNNDDEDSENEKLSPLLSPGSRTKIASTKTLKQVVASLSSGPDADDNDGDDNDVDGGGGGLVVGGAGGDTISSSNTLEVGMKKNSSSLKRTKQRPDLAATTVAAGGGGGGGEPVSLVAAEDSDYYTPEDTQNSILSPLCPTSERAKSGDPLCVTTNVGAVGNSTRANVNTGGGGGGGVVGFSKKNLHKKSTSVGNIVGPGTVDLKCNNVSSLPDMLDSPISGNSASTRSSSDSYSSSSSTKQLLSSNSNATTAANIIVDDKTALQDAVNV